jgi:hypothetical protein
MRAADLQGVRRGRRVVTTRADRAAVSTSQPSSLDNIW